eukprot:CAMPEP_0113476178 /NCGR_PEP_ID=MMETSP0014_2-20120614/19525_1 /TAXON_ID=2857 /ORGANISM="Nitzschia sp." /LENGTH=591 /DNA_ID=CAMNT_0000369167 /DNA_START=60 /DNA_END=1832 /DNA_ORIENTATION=+ /assembly_acc=CAM_ASM_000159
MPQSQSDSDTTGTAAAGENTTKTMPTMSRTKTRRKSTSTSLKRRLLTDGSHGVSHLLPPGDIFRVDDADGGGENSENSENNDRRSSRRRSKQHDDSSKDEYGADENDDDDDDHYDHYDDESSGMELMIHDENQRLQWSIKFFENLHFDLNSAHRDHLHESIERLGRVLFEEQYTKNRRGKYSSKYAEPKTKEDPEWSPIVDVKEVTVPVSMNKSQEEDQHRSATFSRRRSSLFGKTGDSRHKVGTATSNKTSTSSSTTAKALVVIHRLAYEENGSEIVMGRFLLPVQKGLYEVIVIAADDGPTFDAVPELTLTTSSSSTMSPLALNTKTSPCESATDDAAFGCRISPDRDDVSWDEQYPDHCLSRVRKALQWVLEKSEMVVSDPPKQLHDFLSSSSRSANLAEWDLSHIHCRITPPERFLPCPNPDNPESNKYRFCRATLGGTDVEMMVVSCWYGAEMPKGSIKHLRKLAVHASKIIHESQQLFDIKVTVKEVALGKYRQKDSVRWLPLPGVSHPKDAIIATVDCIDAQGRRKQNTIGWVRESVSGNVYLVYFVDTLRSDPKVLHQDLATTLASVRVPRLIPNSIRKKLAW